MGFQARTVLLILEDKVLSIMVIDQSQYTFLINPAVTWKTLITEYPPPRDLSTFPDQRLKTMREDYPLGGETFFSFFHLLVEPS